MLFSHHNRLNQAVVLFIALIALSIISISTFASKAEAQNQGNPGAGACCTQFCGMEPPCSAGNFTCATFGMEADPNDSNVCIVLPRPTNLRYSCNAPRTAATLMWDAADTRYYANGAYSNVTPDYRVRVSGGSCPTGWSSSGGLCVPNIDPTSGTSISFPTAPGVNYGWWVQSYKNGDYYGQPAEFYSNKQEGPSFSCTPDAPPPSDLTANTSGNISITQGQDTILGGTVTNIGAGSTQGPFPVVIFRSDYIGGPETPQVVFKGSTARGIPSGFPPGYGENVFGTFTPSEARTYYYRVCADEDDTWSGVINESNENNNCSGYGSIQVTPAPDPTLTASCSVSPSSITTGGSATWTASPSGGTGSYTYSWTGTDGLSGSGVSVSKTYSSAGTKTGSVTVSSGSQSITQNCGNSLTVVAPAPPTATLTASPTSITYGGSSTLTWSSTNATSCTGSGFSTSGATSGAVSTGSLSTNTSYTVTCTGSGGSATDSATVVVGQAPQPDLTAGRVSPTSVPTGTTLTLQAPIGNSGVSTGAGFTSLFQRASDASGSGATDIGTSAQGTLAQGAQTTATLSYSFSSAGTYYARLCADKSSAGSTGTIAESDENNNCGPWTAITVTDTVQPVSGSCSVSPASITSGGSATWTASPSGGTGSYTYSWTGTDGLSGSGVSVSKTYSTSGSKTASVTITSGSDSKTVACSNGLTVAEAPQPDLTAGGTSPSSATAGTAVSLSAPVSNIGNGVSGSFPSRFQVADSGYTVLANLPSSPSYLGLDAGESFTISGSYTFSSAGTYQVRACANQNTGGTNIAAESNYGNNCGAWTTVTVASTATPADLTAGSVSPTTATAGQATTFTATATNIGGTGSGSFPILFVIGDPDSGNLRNSGYLAGLAPGGSASGSFSYTFPSPGTYQIRACANYNTAWTAITPESNYGNNCGNPTTITVTGVPQAPALSCSASGTNVGIPENVQYTASGASAPYSWATSDGGYYGGGSAATVNRTYTSPGTYGMTVSKAGYTSATCPYVTAAPSGGTCGVPSIDLQASATRVQPGKTVVLTWTGSVNEEGDTCELAGPGVYQAYPSPSCNVGGSFTTPSITAQSTYIISCGYGVNAVTDTVTVNMVPKFEEF
jgi:hypothetical protein